MDFAEMQYTKFTEDGDTLIHSGWMHKKGKIAKNWKHRYFELHENASLHYYTDENKKNMKGTADLLVIIGIHIIDSKNFEVITPYRVWCFECKFKSEVTDWTNYIKNLERSVLYHDRDIINENDTLHMSANVDILKLIADAGDRGGERIRYSNNVTVIKSNKREISIIILTNLAIYFMKPNAENRYKKCEKRILYASLRNQSIGIVSAQSFVLKGVTYEMSEESLTNVMDVLSMQNIQINE